MAAIADAAMAAAADTMREEAERQKSLAAALESSEYHSSDDTALLDVDMRSPLRRAWDNFRKFVCNVLDSLPYGIVSLFCTIWVLFVADARTLSSNISNDAGTDAVTTVIFAIFVTEVSLQSVCRDNYFLTFFFFIDVMAFLSLFPEVPSIWNSVYKVLAMFIFV